MGLLDDFGAFAKTPEGQGLLSGLAGWAANARQGTPFNNIGRGGVSGLMGYSNALDQQSQLGQAEQMKALRDLQIKEAQQKMADSEAMRNFDFSKYYQSPQVQALENGQGPTVENAAKIPNLQQKLDTRGMISGMISSKNPALQQQALGMLTKEEALLKLGKDEQALKKNPDGTYTPVASNVTQDVKNGYLLPDGKGGWKIDPTLFAAEKELKATGAPRVNVPVNVSTEKKYSEQFAGKVADSDMALLEAARKAPDLADRSNRIRQALQSGKVITGFGADARLAVGKALNVVGASDQEIAANTEALSAELARNTLDAIKASGLGSGSGFSNADRDFLNKAAGGMITLEAGTISRLAELSHKAATTSASAWNKRARQIPPAALEGTGMNADPIVVSPLFQPSQPQPGLQPGVRRFNPTTGRIE